MKRITELKTKGSRKVVTPQQVVYALKHRVALAINKIADRDTYQIGVQELEKTAESLNPDGIVTFLSCILDSDSEKKSAVRKECVRMMGVLVKMHGDLIGPHLGKMVGAIVKRLKDQDSVVRDTCVETMGVFASVFGNHQVDNDGIFVLLVRPLFEALGDQNKQTQAGAAICLARVIDSMNDPPVPILQKMLARTMKLLKNPHFMAKPAVIELNKSLIQGGGALSHNALSTAICSIQEALKDKDWTTRKAASLALGELASSGGPFLAPFKFSCVQALESCRFDKVKPVREMVLQAIHCWKSIERQDVLATSDTLSSIKDGLCGDDHSDLVTSGSYIRKDIAYNELKTNIVKKKVPFSTRNESPRFAENSNNDEWHVDIAVPKMHNGIQPHFRKFKSESSSVFKSQETMTADVLSMQGVGHDYDLIDDKHEHSSSFNHVSDNFSNKFMSAFQCHSSRGVFMKPSGGDTVFPENDVETEKQSYLSKAEDRRSLESSVTEVEECRSERVYRSQTQNEISSIQQKLLEIEKKQSSLFDLLQGFTLSTMETLSVIQSKVSSLEHAVDKISHDIVHGGKDSDLPSMGFIENRFNVASPGISNASTPRPAVDMLDRNPSTRLSRNTEVWEGKALVGMKSKSNPISPCLDSRKQPLSMGNRNLTEGTSHHYRKNVCIFSTSGNTQHKERVNENDIWKHIKGLLCEGDLDSAYREVLYSGDQQLLVELIDVTGPVLDNMSKETISNLFTALAPCVLEHRIVDSVLPWLQQIVDLSRIHGPNCVPLSLKVRREILSAVQEALDVEVTHPKKRRLVAQLAMNLQQVWG